MRKNILIVSCIWVTIIGSSLAWNYLHAKTEQQTIALQTAKSFFEQILITRTWNSQHNGVYVPVTEETQPNPYLKDKMRDIRVNENLMLTKVNPAFMTRQIAEIANDNKGVKFHITSLNPLRPQNEPTPREEKALQAFETGTTEVSAFIQHDSSRKFFYMAPLKVEQSCLQCHAEQGYSLGEVRGGISVSLPYTPEIPIIALVISHLAIGLFGLIGIVFSGTKEKRCW